MNGLENLENLKIFFPFLENRNRPWRFRSILTLYRNIEKKSGTFLHFCKKKCTIQRLKNKYETVLLKIN